MSMFLGYGKLPNISQNGLVLYLDSRNDLSYRSGISGTRWKDLSQIDITATLMNGTVFDNTSRAVSFDGSNDYVDCGTNTATSFAGDYTINFWINMPVVGPGGIVMMRSTQTPSANGFINYQFQIATGDKMRLNMQTDQFGGGNVEGGVMSANTWYYITGRRSGGSIEIYYNAVSQATGTLNTNGTYTGPTANWTSTTLKLGDRMSVSWSGGAFSGYIGGVEMYNRALSNAEISQNFNSTRSKYGV